MTMSGKAISLSPKITDRNKLLVSLLVGTAVQLPPPDIAATGWKWPIQGIQNLAGFVSEPVAALKSASVVVLMGMRKSADALRRRKG